MEPYTMELFFHNHYFAPGISGADRLAYLRTQYLHAIMLSIQ